VAAPAPVTRPSNVVQDEAIVRADTGARGASRIATSGSADTIDAANSNASTAAPAARARPQSPVAMKAGGGSNSAYAQAKAESQQQVAAATPPPAAPNSPAPAAAAPAPVAGKQSPINSRAGGERQAQLMEKVAPRARLRVTVDELKGPDTSPTSETDVADDGTIGLPKLEQRVRVEGLTRAQAQQAIHDAYKAANVVDEPNVTVEPVPAPPPFALAARSPGHANSNAPQQQIPAAQATQPAGRPEVPASQEIANAEPGQPQAAPTSGPTIADEPLDVVILVQRSPGASLEPGATTPVENAAPNAATVAEPNQAAVPDAAKPAAPAEPATPSAAAPSVPEAPAPPAAPEPPAPSSSPSELPAK
jgi:hypothetical protein